MGQGKEHIDLTIASDLNKTTAKNYEVLLDDLIGLGSVSARAAFVIDKSGVIQYAEQTPTPKELPNFDAIKAKLASLNLAESLGLVVVPKRGPPPPGGGGGPHAPKAIGPRRPPIREIRNNTRKTMKKEFWRCTAAVLTIHPQNPKHPQNRATIKEDQSVVKHKS